MFEKVDRKMFCLSRSQGGTTEFLLCFVVSTHLAGSVSRGGCGCGGLRLLRGAEEPKGPFGM